MSQNSKRLPKYSMTLIFAFNNDSDLQKFLEAEDYKKCLNSLEEIATRMKVRKIEKLPHSETIVELKTKG